MCRYLHVPAIQIRKTLETLFKYHEQLEAGFPKGSKWGYGKSLFPILLFLGCGVVSASAHTKAVDCVTW